MDAAGVRWLVTGASGQLGLTLVARARERGLDVIATDREQLDVTDGAAIEAALDELEPAVVVNAAAFTAVDECESEDEDARRVNAEAPGLLAQACAGRTLLIHLSTDYVFDGRSPEPVAEEAAPAPLQVYGRWKLEGEERVREAGGEHLIVRTSWLFGPGPNFVRAILARAASGGPLRVVTDEAGQPTWTGTLANALLEVASGTVRGTLHVANRGVTTRHAFAREIVAEGARRGWNGEIPVEPILRADLGLAAERPAHTVLDLGRAREASLDLPHWREALVDYLDDERG